MANNIPAIGIDLGTTFSAVAYVDETGKPAVLKSSEGNSVTPSVIAFTDDGYVFGEEAKRLQALGEANIASFFKRQIGNRDFYWEFNGKKYDATDLSSLLLGKLKADAEAELGCSVSKAVITVPAYFDNSQRNATVEAGKQAGLEVLRIINEPTAAAITYGFNQVGKSDFTGEKTVMVYDLGGGTFDVTLLKITPEMIDVIATDGNHQLGGKDWDARIMSSAALQFKEEYGIDPLSDIETSNDIAVRSEEVKKTLSARTTATIHFVCNGNKGKYTFSRMQFEEATADLLEQTRTLCGQVLLEAKMQWQDIDGVLLVGGSTRMPQVVDAVREMSGKEPLTNVNVDEAVATGAAIQAAIDTAAGHPSELLLETKQKKIARLTIQDVTSHSLGMIAENENRTAYINAIILRHNSKIPSSDVRPLQFKTTENKNDMELEVYLLQGESEHPCDCSILGRYVFSGITHEPKGMAVLEITYNYDKNGIVNVSGKQKTTGRALKMRTEPIPADMSWINGSPRNQHRGTIGEHITVIVAVDCSYSMNGVPMEKAREAAKQFLHKVELSHFSVSVMAVADRIELMCPPTQNAKQIEEAIDSLDCEGFTVGFGNGAQPFTEAKQIFDKIDGAKFIIVLTDGVWEEQDTAIKEAKTCHAAGIGVAALGFGAANQEFLREIASCDENAMFTDLSRIGDSFSTIAQVLTQGSRELTI